MTLRTPLCDLLGIAVPIGSAGMAGGTAGPELAAAVSEAGGLGGLGGINSGGGEELRRRIRRTRELTSRPFSVNLWVHILPAAPEFLDVCIEERVPSVTFSFGDPAPYAGRARDAGILVLHQAQDMAGVRAGVAAGVDVIVTQGGEAGGRRPTGPAASR
jgi:nitronate monooxygenase